jgi:hypothetical protein
MPIINTIATTFISATAISILIFLFFKMLSAIVDLIAEWLSVFFGDDFDGDG